MNSERVNWGETFCEAAGAGVGAVLGSLTDEFTGPAGTVIGSTLGKAAGEWAYENL